MSTAPMGRPQRQTFNKSCTNSRTTNLRLFAALALLVFLAIPPLVPAPPASVTDLYISNCTQIPDPPPNGFLRWSAAATWTTLGFSGVPGIGALTRANVTIPCGVAILLDVPTLNLTRLQIQGLLKVEDPVPVRTYSVAACFVLVEGQLNIGNATNHFKSKIVFTLMPNPMNRQAWTANFVWPAEPAFPRSMGHKAFAVMGGQVRLHGMPNGPNTPSWIKLNANARAGDFQIIVDRDVRNQWPVGSRIAISSTDYTPDKAEEFTITGYDTDPKGTIITLDTRLIYNHYGNPTGIPDGFGGFIDERAEVALLTRNIVITGFDEPPPNLFEGGHFIVFMTGVPQFIEGVEYWLMGQQGVLGRYNIHFHVCGDDGGRSVVRKNSIHDSKQRCVVVHGTHNLTVDSNVAFNTSGHCFMVEEGGEMNNTFINNLGFLQRSVTIKIADDESDNSPSTFWITNMLNNYINNVAGGSDDSGFWTELKPEVRGMSLRIPRLNGIIPNWTPFGIYRNNTVHSCRGPGWRFYPKGVNPHAIYDWNMTTNKNQWQWPSQDGFIYDLKAWKLNSGIFMHNTANVYLVNATISDCTWGMEFNTNYRAGIMGSKFLALSNNYGTPNNWWCTNTADLNWQMLCAPVSGCEPGSNSSNWRSRNWNHWRNPTFGIIMDSPCMTCSGWHVYNLTNNRFSGYEPQCGRVTAAMGTGISGMNRQWWPSNQAISGYRASTTTANSFWFAPINFTWPNTYSAPSVNGYWEAQTNFAVWDRDGSLVGGTGGHLIVNNPGLLPPVSRVQCTARPEVNAFACPNTCYRTIQFTYLEDAFFPLPRDAPQSRQRGDFSYIVVRRIEDNVTRILDGNANDTSTSGTWRSFWVTLFAPATYEVSIRPPFNNSNFWPGNLTIQYDDDGACGAPVTFRILPIPSSQWSIDTNDYQFWAQCPGVSFSNSSTPWTAQYQYVCWRNRQVLQINMLGNMNPSRTVFLTASKKQVLPCRLPVRCGVWNNADYYYYNTSAADIRSPKPGAMGYQTPLLDQSTWTYGQALVGNSGWGWDQVRSVTPMFNGTNGYTFYARKSFTIANSACYAGLYLDFIQYNGILVTLNNIEVFRWNLPDGNITNNTISLVGPPWPNPLLNTTFINITATNASFVEGTNYLAFEFHSVSSWASSPYFDTRLSLLLNSLACTGASIMPEVCDGLDNNFDGLVDVDPSTGRLFERPCWTACGRGIETCINGAFQNCTAPPSLPETCNGRDDNCDGLIDNGGASTQMDCAAGSVCFQGQCLPQGPLTVPVPVFPRNNDSWWFLDQGWAWQTYPNWTNARFSSNVQDTTIRQFKQGVAPFGTSAYIWPINTTLIRNANPDIYYFFLKNFTLSAEEAANTWSLSVNVRRDTGAVVWSNGVEILRSNFPASWVPSSPGNVFPVIANNCPACWWPNNATRTTGVLSGAARAGTNWIAAQVANTNGAGQFIHFDMELIRNVNQSCSSLPGSPTQCVRNPPNDTVWFNFGATWKYLDLTLPLPPVSWIERTFDDSAWPSGPAPLGLQTWTSTRLQMNRTTRQAYYFRRTFTLSDANCHYNALFQLRALDGAVVYVNGVEAFRFQWQGPWVLPTSFSSTNWPPSDKANFTLPGGWLVNGLNTIAAEIHPCTQNTQNWFFDLALSGQREGANCTPLPP